MAVSAAGKSSSQEQRARRCEQPAVHVPWRRHPSFSALDYVFVLNVLAARTLRHGNGKLNALFFAA
jgi:hypothetical protein